MRKKIIAVTNETWSEHFVGQHRVLISLLKYFACRRFVLLNCGYNATLNSSETSFWSFSISKRAGHISLRPQMKKWTESYSVCSGKSTSTTTWANPRLARPAVTTSSNFRNIMFCTKYSKIAEHNTKYSFGVYFYFLIVSESSLLNLGSALACAMKQRYAWLLSLRYLFRKSHIEQIEP
jgi:hypothetical protein